MRRRRRTNYDLIDSFMSVERLIGRKRSRVLIGKITKTVKYGLPLDQKHRCPKCRKKRAFSTLGEKAWEKEGLFYICPFCVAEKNGTLDELKSKLASMRKVRRKERVSRFVPVLDNSLKGI